MDFSLTKEQNLLKNSFRDFLIKECPADHVREMEQDQRGYSLDLWHKMSELGWLGLVFQSKYGGMDGNFLELALLLEEMSYFALPGPFFTAVVLGGLSILSAGDEKQIQTFIPMIAKGESIVTLALIETSANYEPEAIHTKASPYKKNNFSISGIKLFVPDMHVADHVICVALTKSSKEPENNISLFLINSKKTGINYTKLNTISADRQFEVNINQVKVSGEDLLGKLHQGWAIVKKILQQAAIAKCAEMIGGAQWILDTTISYAKKRVQFNHPVGSFQAIQHKCANMLVDLEGARFVTYEAAWKQSKGLPVAMEASIAKAWVSGAYQKICDEGHQIHGGIGIINDHDMPLYSQRAKAYESIFGDPDFHREMIAQQLAM